MTIPLGSLMAMNGDRTNSPFVVSNIIAKMALSVVFVVASIFPPYRVLKICCISSSVMVLAIAVRSLSLVVSFALSIITDLGGKDLAVTVTHEEVINAANVAEPKICAILKEMLKRLDEVGI